ncbi:unnamed protein product [Chrysodeixis includens]|uniref:SMP-LTD domain-containing protein n=1 Tax=Chrysodeixis includens TaxID=689277 RepID=A0A9P0BLG8_CHRIL|nr:unnamed protein product [Chrysodeixis includens]
MEISGVGKSPNSSLSFRYNANNEELEELYHVCEDDPPTPQCDPAPATPGENASPKRGERSSSIIDKYFKSIRTEKLVEKPEDAKPVESKPAEEAKPAVVPKEVTSSPMKEYLNRLGKRSQSEVSPDVKEGTNETWKIFHDFKFKIAQAVEDMKTRSLEEGKEKSLPRDNSTSDSEENSAIKDSDQQSVGDTDNQVSSLDSSIQNLSEMTQPLTAKATERESSLPVDKNHSDSSDDTHKNLLYNDSGESRDILSDSSIMEVESGIEALEDTIDGFGDIHNVDPHFQSTKPVETEPLPSPHHPHTTFGAPPNKSNTKLPHATTGARKYFFNFSMYFLTFLIFFNYLLFPNSNVWNGFVLGLWFFCFTSNLKCWVLDTYFGEETKSATLLQLKRSSAMPPTYTIPSVMEHRPIKKYEGWINHYRFPDYNPYTYHINKTTTAFMKLEGCNLRISYTRTKIPKRALWDEKLEKVAFYQHRLYNLTGARIILMPKGLVKRRQWSKKYPICIILNDKEKIQVLEKESSATDKKATESQAEKKKEQHEMETETSVSPEKKKKFVWRRREKSLSHSDGESGKEGLRHRLVRKMHRDKKTDNVSTATEPAETQSQIHVQTDRGVFLDDSYHELPMPSRAERDLASTSATSTKDEDEDIDECELSKFKDFLEETEMEIAADGTGEGEWSVHVKRTSDKHAYLYLFARTGRDKHEWYRRLMIAVTEGNAASAETSAAEDKPAAADAAPENRDNIEMAVYKLTEKETVAFAKASSKTLDSSISDGGGVTITSISQPMPPETDYEKTFWPYLLKIIQSHEMTLKQTTEVAVLCQIEPSPRERKKKRKDSKSPSPECQCRMLPAEVTWVNTMLARLMYDVMRDPVTIARLQNRIQRKLNTLKLPSFMSPLVVTELSLAGACPLVERVQAPAWDARGVWLDADLRYDGGAYIAILTQINLLKLKEKNVTLEEELMKPAPCENLVDPAEIDANLSGPVLSKTTLRTRKPAIFDSDVEDSAESSSDDESPPVQPVDSTETIGSTDTVLSSTAAEGGSSKKKFLRMVDKIATNKYFQQVTDYKYVKRAMEGLSNTDIKLHLEVHALEGRLAFNLPPPPHDRLWIGFRTNPQLVLKARPAVGARTLRFAHISNWIEQKLSKEFEKVLVLPNMEDIIVDIMTPTPVQFE